MNPLGCREQSRRLSDVDEGFEGDLPPMGNLEGNLDDLLPPVHEDEAGCVPHQSSARSDLEMGVSTDCCSSICQPKIAV